MAKIRFETGQVVNFDGNPTPQDIEEVAQKLNIQKPKEAGSFLGDITRAVLKPAVTLATRPFQAAKSIASTIREPLKEPELDVNLPFFGKIEAPRTKGDVVKDIGRGIQTVALAAPVSKLAGAATTGARTLGATRGAELLGRIAAGGGLGFAFDVGAGLEAGEGKEAFKPGLATGIGVAIPSVAVGSKFLKSKAFPKEPIDTLVGRITQGTKPEIFKAKKALELIDTTGVKTYSNLKEVATHKISELATKQDNLLSKLGRTHKASELTTQTLVGKVAVKQNFVKTAVGHLRELYQKTFDTKNLAKITQLERKLNKEGLTTKEINDLAREYGVEFGRKAFNKLGEPLTSINSVGFENIRKGVKATARKLLPNKASEAIDESMTNLFTLQRTSEKLERAVQKLSNKVKARGIFERIGKAAGHTVDVITGGLPRSFLTSFLPSNIGNKVMNSLDLEKELAKNLSRINFLVEKGTDTQITSFLNQLTKAGGILKMINKEDQ